MIVEGSSSTEVQNILFVNPTPAEEDCADPTWNKFKSLQHLPAVPTVIIDGFMDTGPTDGSAVDNNTRTVGKMIQIIHVYDARITDG
ncbi:hypothetical protein PIB30_056499 [Stylosanthes scabra]|uniref:Uncharacterized protein n=1 Tax=Stylosanthes scabra TaxID=79078 RepID=A0ABU6VKG2_9FABA|nr:hypothetical protein [Stylosanthes scabra]